MAFLGVSIKKGNFRGIRKNRQNPISGNMAIADSRMVIFRTTKKEAKFQDPENKVRISGPPKIGRFSGPKKQAEKPDF